MANKQIVFEWDGKEYTLEFNKKTVRDLERDGFVAGQVSDKPMTMFPMLLHGAFQMHHRKLKESIIDEIYEAIPDKEGFIQALVELYNAPLEALMDEPETEDTSKKIEWTKSW